MPVGNVNGTFIGEPDTMLIFYVVVGLLKFTI